ncbi:MAG: phosphotransferase [Coriobacteriia bacterium]
MKAQTLRSMERNAYALVAHQLLSASLGLVYWLLAARLYSATVVGASSAFISALLLVSSISQVGLAGGMARFVPRAGRHARRLVSSAYVVAIVASVIGGIVFLVLHSMFDFGDVLLGGLIQPWWVVLAVIGWTVFYLQDGVLIGTHQAVWVLAENFVYNFLKIAILVAGASMLGQAGIIGSWFLPVPVAIVLVTWLVFGRFLRPHDEAGDAPPEIRVTLREFAFSVSGDHVGTMASEATVRLLPAFVVATMGAAENAYFYQAWMVTNVLGLIASGMTNSFTAETAAAPGKAGENSRKILKRIAELVVPATVLVGVGAPLILGVFGPAYAREGSTLLRWLALATLPFIFNTWYLAYLRVVRRIRGVVVIQVSSSALMIALTFLGLNTMGIAGVGVAWLITQIAVTAATARDAARVLSTKAARRPALRRSDWRFLLPGPAPKKTAIFAKGPLAESATALPGDLVAGGSSAAVACDLCVARWPGAARLHSCADALRPGGVLYAEWPPIWAGAGRLRRDLRRAGFESPVFYWPSPSLSAARLWVRVSPRPAPYGAAIRSVFDASMGSGVRSRIASSLVLAASLTPFAPKVAVARKGGIADEADPDLMAWLAGRLAEISGADASDLAVVMRTGGGSDLNRINWMVWGDAERTAKWIAKAPRIPETDIAMRRERDLLLALAARAEGGLAMDTPRLAMWDERGGFPVMAETAMQGTELLEVVRSVGYEESARQIARTLTAFAGRPPKQPRSEWWDDLVEPWLARLEGQLAELGDPGLVGEVRSALQDLGDLPLVFCHYDCTPWNMLVAENGRLQIFDWENGREEGLPALDLVYCLSTIAFSLDGTVASPRAIESYTRMIDPSTEAGRVFLGALDAYGEAVGIDLDDLLRLRAMTWLIHTTHNFAELLKKHADDKESITARSACLPLLRAELAALAARRVPAAESASAVPPWPGSDARSTSALFISPHLDDAALSCGGLIHRLSAEGAGVVVATVCTEDYAGGGLSALARQSHRQWDLGETPFLKRREEDIEACRLLGAQPLHLGMRDAVYRSGEGGRAYEKFITACDSRDATLFLARAEKLLGPLFAENPGSLVFCPASIGGHVDHTLVRHAVEQLCRAERIIYYVEYPYWSRGRCVIPGQQDSLRSASPELVVLTDEELEARMAAVACYRSQLRGLFPSPSERAKSILDARVPVLGSWVLGKPDHAASVRRMEEQLRRDVAKCGGEYYLWMPIEGRIPFPYPASAGTSSSDLFATLGR